MNAIYAFDAAESIGHVLMQMLPCAGTKSCKHEIDFQIEQCCHLARIGFGE